MVQSFKAKIIVSSRKHEGPLQFSKEGTKGRGEVEEDERSRGGAYSIRFLRPLVNFGAMDSWWREGCAAAGEVRRRGSRVESSERSSAQRRSISTRWNILDVMPDMTNDC